MMKRLNLLISLVALLILIQFSIFSGMGRADQTIGPTEWLINSDFSSSNGWITYKGEEGDNSTLDAFIGNNQANYRIIGENYTFSEISGTPNSSTSLGWSRTKNSGFLFPESSGIDSQGCYVIHTWAEDPNQFPSVHFRKNVSLGVNMLDYNITSISLSALFNASASTNLEAGNDNASAQYYAIGDFVIFYIQISDIQHTTTYTVASFQTTRLGQNTPQVISLTDHLIDPYDDNYIITALMSALEKDPSHSNFTITIGIDIYSEDNISGTDTDTYTNLVVSQCNFTFTYEKNIDKFSSVSWQQEGAMLSGEDIQITNAILNFKYKIDQSWPTQRSPFSELQVLINNNQNRETIALNDANSSFQDAKMGGFDVTSLILKDVNISVAIMLYIANTFGWNDNITISVDDVHLLITYIILEPGFDILPLIIGLSGGILAIVIGYVSYQTHFKYPPMVRKMKKIRKKINKGGKIKPTNILNRNILVAKNLQDKIDKSEYEHAPIEKKMEKKEIIKEEN